MCNNDGRLAKLPPHTQTHTRAPPQTYTYLTALCMLQHSQRLSCTLGGGAAAAATAAATASRGQAPQVKEGDAAVCGGGGQQVASGGLERERVDLPAGCVRACVCVHVCEQLIRGKTLCMQRPPTQS